MKSILLAITTVLLLNGSAAVATETQLRGGSRGLEQDRRILYPDVRVENGTPYTATFTVNYASIFCSNDNNKSVSKDGLWKGSRGLCLITSITASVKTEDNETVRCSSYSSSGTSYSTFAVMWGGANSCSVQRTDQNNGIDIINKTPFPLQVSLNQIGPLYWDIIQPGESFSRDTGSVWFTIQASTYIEGSTRKITTSDSTQPVVVLTVAVLAVAFTGGTFGVIALPGAAAILVGGAVLGGSAATTNYTGKTVAAVEEIFSEKNTSVSKGSAYATSNPRPVWEVRGGPYLKPTIVDGEQVQELLGSELTLTKIDM